MSLIKYAKIAPCVSLRIGLRRKGNRWHETLVRPFSRSEISLYIYRHVSVYSAFADVLLTLDVDSCLMISLPRVEKKEKK